MVLSRLLPVLLLLPSVDGQSCEGQSNHFSTASSCRVVQKLLTDVGKDENQLASTSICCRHRSFQNIVSLLLQLADLVDEEHQRLLPRHAERLAKKVQALLKIQKGILLGFHLQVCHENMPNATKSSVLLILRFPKYVCTVRTPTVEGEVCALRRHLQVWQHLGESVFEHRRFADALHARRAEDRKLGVGPMSVLALDGIADVVLHDIDCIRTGVFDNLWGL